jgi:hypothetical protein
MARAYHNSRGNPSGNDQPRPARTHQIHHVLTGPDRGPLGDLRGPGIHQSGNPAPLRRDSAAGAQSRKGREVVGMAEIEGVAGKIVRSIRFSDQRTSRIEIEFTDDTCLHFSIGALVQLRGTLHVIDGENISMHVHSEAS